MNPEAKSQLVDLMVAMAEGDHAAVFPFVDMFGPDIARMVRSQLRSYGRLDLLRQHDEITGLVHSAAFEILDRAGSWDPAGAPPWVWAANAISSAVTREIGHALVDLDDERFESQLAEPGSSGGRLDLDDLAVREPHFGLLREAIALASSQRDRDIAEQYLIQQALGDPSPSHTVATEFDLSPANVRQIVCRVRGRVRRLQADDDRYRDLGRSGWLAA
jgi:hypothetical protein